MADSRFSHLSKSSVISAAVGGLSALGVLSPEFAILALPGIGMGILAFVEIRKYEQRGLWLARFGIAVSLTFALAVTPSWHIYQYKSEALPEHERLNFKDLTLEEDGLSRFVGRHICLKGYAYRTHRNKVHNFILSPGGSVRKTETLVFVILPSGETWNWTDRPIAVSGILTLNPRFASDPTTVRFVLKQSCVRESRTGFGLAFRDPWDGC